MDATYPMLTPRGSMCVALRRVWPWNFNVWQTAHGLGVRLRCKGIAGSVTLFVENEILPDNCETVAGGIARIAWDLLIKASVAEQSPERPSANRMSKALERRLSASGGQPIIWGHARRA